MTVGTGVFVGVSGGNGVLVETVLGTGVTLGSKIGVWSLGGIAQEKRNTLKVKTRLETKRGLFGFKDYLLSIYLRYCFRF
jgi:hypothetical protein